MGLVINLLIYLLGIITGVGLMALACVTGKNDAYDAGYEMGLHNSKKEDKENGKS